MTCKYPLHHVLTAINIIFNVHVAYFYTPELYTHEIQLTRMVFINLSRAFHWDMELESLTPEVLDLAKCVNAMQCKS